MQGVVRHSKDAVLAFAIRRLLNVHLEAVGEIVSLSVDGARRRARMAVALRGEREAIDVHVRKYQLERAQGRDWLTVVDADASRDWITGVMHQFVIGRRFDMSPRAAAVMRALT